MMSEKTELAAEMLLALYAVMVGGDSSNTLNVYPNATQYIGFHEVMNEVTIDLPSTYHDGTLFLKEINKDKELRPVTNYSIVPSNSHKISLSSLSYGDDILIDQVSAKFLNYDGKFLYYSDGNSINLLDINNSEKDIKLVFDSSFSNINHVRINGNYENVMANYVFSGIGWNPSYRIFIDDKSRTGYFDYDIILNNNTDKDYKEFNINLLNNPLSVNNRPMVRQENMLRSVSIADTMEQPVLNVRETDYINIIELRNVSLNAGETSVITYKSGQEFNYKVREDILINEKDEYFRPKINLKINKKENKLFENLSAGKVRVFDERLSILTEYSYRDNYAENFYINIGESEVKSYSLERGDSELFYVKEFEVNVVKNLGDTSPASGKIEFLKEKISINEFENNEDELFVSIPRNSIHAPTAKFILNKSIDDVERFSNKYMKENKMLDWQNVSEYVNELYRYLQNNNIITYEKEIKDGSFYLLTLKIS